jgi:D-alanyl-D-alanine carboxypeptidase
MQLVERGKLDVDDRLTVIADRYHAGDEGALEGLINRYRERVQGVTLRELLNHTSGLADALDTKAFAEALARDPLGGFGLPRLAGFGLQAPPVFTPGAPGKWNYSNTDYFLLGMVLQAVTGEPVGAQMDSLFKEAGMRDSHYAPPPAALDAPPIAASLIQGYMPGTGPNAKQPTILSFFDGAPTATAQIKPQAVQNVSTNPSESGPTVRVSPAGPAETARVERRSTFTYKDVTHAYTLKIGRTAGGIVSNTEDLARFYRALFEGKLVDASTLAQMEQTVPTGENSKGVEVRWGFGFGQQRIDPGVLYPGSPRLTVWMHLGDIFGWESAAYYVPQEDLVVTNTDNLFPTPVGDLGLLRNVLRVEIDGD